MKIQGPTQEMTEFFVTRTKYHIALVQKHMNTLATILPHGGELIQRGLDHDKSKWSDQERVPYIWLSYFHKCRKDGVTLTYPDGVEKAIERAIAHHVTHNRHHHEFHPNHDQITKVDLIEMVCDWTAVAEELNQDNHSAKIWTDKVVGTKVKLNDEKTAFLYNTIKILDEIRGIKHPAR